MTGAEIAAAFPIGSIAEIVVAAALIVVAVKLAKSIAKPMIAVILIVAALLLVFGVVDLTTFKETGEKLADSAWSCASSEMGDSNFGGDRAGAINP